MQELKAIEILKEELEELRSRGQQYSYIREKKKKLKEAIKELEEYEQNFKQKEFEYRTNCQNLVSAERVEADNMPDRLAELEKVILDCYLAKGYKVGIGEWGFKVDITSLYKQKAIHIYFYDNNDNESVIKFFSKTTKEMFDKAIEHFSVRQKEVNKCQ